METKTLIITSQGTAREQSRLVKPEKEDYVWDGLKPYRDWDSMYRDAMRVYKASEDSLKEYKIVGQRIQHDSDGFLIIKYSGHLSGTTHQFKVNEVDKTCIIL